MNERIKELAEQCWNLPDIPEYANYRKFNQGKFAVLIVKECAGIVETESERGTDHTITQILKHFGVEE